MSQPKEKPRTVCINIPMGVRQGLLTESKGPRRFVQRPPPKTAMPVLRLPGHDSASYKEFFQSLYDAALITGPNGEIMDVNARAIEFLLYEQNELTQMHITEVIAGTDETLLEAIRVNFENQSITSIEAYCLRKDQSYFPAEIIVHRLKHSTTGTYCFFIRDATRRKQAEETLASERNLLRTLIDSLPDYIYVKDAECRYLLDNIAHRRYVKVQSPADVFGKTVYDFFPPEIAHQHYAEEQELIQNCQPVIDREELLVDLSNDPKWVSTSKMPLLDQNGKAVGLVGVSRDITQYKLSDEKLRNAAEKLEKNNRELQDFAYIASHDLQEPLRKIQAFGDRLKAKFGSALSEEGQDYLMRMQNAASRMQTLINNLLTLSRVTTKARPFSNVDLNEILREVLGDLEVRVEQTGGRVEASLLPSIAGDPIQLRQLFQNLIGNALKFHKPDVPPVVRIHHKIIKSSTIFNLDSSAADLCQIFIEDNGIGFEEKYLETIFTPFSRLHGREEYEGTGIGLAICRKIADRHGGTITATSQPGEGTCFIVTLPVKQLIPDRTSSQPT
jgi:two-component system, LuxR family, sensor kinase FixL